MEMRSLTAALGLHSPCVGLDLLAASTFVAAKLAPRGASNAVYVTLALMAVRDLVPWVFTETTKEGRPLLRARGMRCGKRFTCVRCVDGQAERRRL